TIPNPDRPGGVLIPQLNPYLTSGWQKHPYSKLKQNNCNVHNYWYNEKAMFRSGGVKYGG
ncbi:hypothetical protein, partial [uncultured Clostridium sp.]|uniref:hypothetical protein n=1 Tax=uncultured Clostridium sp. TaxID=59620 RepID=UPI0025D9A48F